MAYQRCKEGTWSAQAVDAQCVVRSVLVGPLLVVNQSRRQCVQFKVADTVATNNHGSLLLVECLNDGFERLGRRVDVVAIKLHGEASAAAVANGNVPASANAQVGTLRNEVYEVRIGFLQLVQYFGCSVGRVVINNDNIEGEVGLLSECRFHCVGHSLHAVVHRNNDRSLVLEVLLVKVGVGIF